MYLSGFSSMHVHKHTHQKCRIQRVNKRWVEDKGTHVFIIHPLLYGSPLIRYVWRWEGLKVSSSHQINPISVEKWKTKLKGMKHYEIVILQYNLYLFFPKISMHILKMILVYCMLKFAIKHLYKTPNHKQTERYDPYPEENCKQR